jgi:WD40 repeat protein
LRHPDAAAPAVTTVCLLPPADPSAGAGAHDGIVRTWDVSVDARKGKAKVEGDHRMFVGHEGAVTCVAAGPGGDHFASCGHDKTVRVWNRAGGFIDDGSHSKEAGKKLKKSSKRRKGEDEGEFLFFSS